jgi:hypothetical protein
MWSGACQAYFAQDSASETLWLPRAGPRSAELLSAVLCGQADITTNRPFSLTSMKHYQRAGTMLERFPPDTSQKGFTRARRSDSGCWLMEVGMDGQAVIDGPAVASIGRG